jgi:hypothetical protein
VLQEASYAANGIKHCVRPADMAGKSAALILRRINPAAMAAACELHMQVKTPPPPGSAPALRCACRAPGTVPALCVQV